MQRLRHAERERNTNEMIDQMKKRGRDEKDRAVDNLNNKADGEDEQ